MQSGEQTVVQRSERNGIPITCLEEGASDLGPSALKPSGAWVPPTPSPFSQDTLLPPTSWLGWGGSAPSTPRARMLGSAGTQRVGDTGADLTECRDRRQQKSRTRVVVLPPWTRVEAPGHDLAAGASAGPCCRPIALLLAFNTHRPCLPSTRPCWPPGGPRPGRARRGTGWLPQARQAGPASSHSSEYPQPSPLAGPGYCGLWRERCPDSSLILGGSLREGRTEGRRRRGVGLH